MNLLCSARSKHQESTEYTPLEHHGLTIQVAETVQSNDPKGPQTVHVSLHNANSTSWSGVIHIELPFPNQNPRFFLPAFMYGRNRGESPQDVTHEFPRIRKEMKRPSSPWWMVRSDRLSHPVAAVYDNGTIYALSASPYFILDRSGKKEWKPNACGDFYQYSGFTCSLEKGTIGYTLGYENAPWLFVQSKNVYERSDLSDNCFVLYAEETVEFDLNVYCYQADSCLSVNYVIASVYSHYHQSPRRIGEHRTAVTELAGAISEYGWVENDVNYSTIIYETKDPDVFDYVKIMSIAWTCGMSIAGPMLIAGLRLNNKAMRDQAIRCINNIIDNATNPRTGLPFDAYDNGVWTVHGWWFDGMHTSGHTSYLIGQALFYILRSYEYEKTLNHTIHDKWLSYVKEALPRLERTKNSDAEYAYIISAQTGAGLEYDAFCGAWCMAALAYYCFLSGDLSYLPSLIESEAHYYGSYIANMECYGAPLDTVKAVDSEGVLAYIKAVKFLHKITANELYLDHMYDALCYEFSFKFCYNSPVKLPPLSKNGWSSCGGSVTSTANPHIHPMSSNVVDEMLYYCSQRSDAYIQQRMTDTVLWGCQTYNKFDGEYDHGKIGWMSERFCHCEGLVTQKYEDGTYASTWFSLMPWAGASIIDGFVGDLWEQSAL